MVTSPTVRPSAVFICNHERYMVLYLQSRPKPEFRVDCVMRFRGGRGKEVIEMTAETCPQCGCAIVGTGYEMNKMIYCCVPCANGDSCVCGCCGIAEEDEEAD